MRMLGATMAQPIRKVQTRTRQRGHEDTNLGCQSEEDERNALHKWMGTPVGSLVGSDVGLAVGTTVGAKVGWQRSNENTNLVL